jgi:very-short-patch-repair endonuclease
MLCIPDGPFTRVGSGLSKQSLRSLLGRGTIRRLGYGVYAPTAAPDSLELRAAALALVVPPHTVICRTTAAWMYGLDVRQHAEDLCLDLAVTEGAAAVRRPDVRGFVEMFDESDVVLIGDLRVTTPTRTAADLGRWLPRYRAIGVLDLFLRSGLVTREQLLAEEERWFGFKGIRQLRELIRFADPRSESHRESWLRLLLHDAGFPETELQIPIDRGPGREPYRLDLGIEEQHVGFEYDGDEAHPPEQEAADAARRSYIRRQGWTVIVVRRGDLERPQRLVDAVGMFVAPVRRPRQGLEVRTGFVGPPRTT